MAEEVVILVNEANRTIGAGDKLSVHRDGLLHRAFSIFLLDATGKLLLQRRSNAKYHSGGLWANSCCGHPRPGEKSSRAANRRMQEELGVRASLRFGFRARYCAQLDNGMRENEIVYVYFGELSEVPKPDPAEISEVSLVSFDDLHKLVTDSPATITCWLKEYVRSYRGDLMREWLVTGRGLGN